MKQMNVPVAITGMGIVSSIGHNIKEFTGSLKGGHSGIGKLTGLQGNFTFPCIGAEINDFTYANAIKQYCTDNSEAADRALRSVRRSTASVQICATAALEAFAQSGVTEKNIPSERRGIVVAGSNLTCNLQYGLHGKFNDNPEYITPSYALNFMDTDHVGTLSEIFQICGEGFTVGGASASGNVAIIKGMQLICAGIVDFCMVVGAMTDFSPMEIQAFHNLGAMGGKKLANEPAKACRPFDQEHEGFIYGQAGACLILESMESAERRGADVLAKLAGGAFVLDGSRLSEPNEDGEVRAMQNALDQAGVCISNVDYINAHGTSTPLGDIVELKAIKRVAGDSIADIWINSTKSLTGHCLYSAGVVEAIATIVQMRESFIHPNLNLDNPIDTTLRLCGSEAEKVEIKTAISNSFGFGGINTSIIIEKGV